MINSYTSEIIPFGGWEQASHPIGRVNHEVRVEHLRHLGLYIFFNIHTALLSKGSAIILISSPRPWSPKGVGVNKNKNLKNPTLVWSRTMHSSCSSINTERMFQPFQLALPGSLPCPYPYWALSWRV